jgi:hypothetical protein
MSRKNRIFSTTPAYLEGFIDKGNRLKHKKRLIEMGMVFTKSNHPVKS